MKKNPPWGLIIILALFGLFLMVLLLWLYLATPLNSSGEEKIFVIPQGQSTVQIASRLEEQKLIRSKLIFLLSLKLYRQEGRLQAGSFRLSSGMTLRQIITTLGQGRLDQWLTVIEGWRREQIAAKVEAELGIDQNDFLAASEGKEGALFPDTYLVPVNASAEQVVEIMTANFETRTAGIVLPAKINRQQWVILASLVEREAKRSDDRRRVAGILLKRWRQGWPLQVDATVQYAKSSQKDVLDVKTEKWWPTVSVNDLKIVSPYNTYLQTGLPPGPICSPSLDSLQAVVNPDETSYWFYLSDKNGDFHYAATYKEHQINIEQFLH